MTGKNRRKRRILKKNENLTDIFSFNLFKSCRKTFVNAIQHFEQSCFFIIHTNPTAIDVVYSIQYAKIGLIDGSIRGCFSSQFLFEIQIFYIFKFVYASIVALYIYVTGSFFFLLFPFGNI